MTGTISKDLLVRILVATPEKLKAIEKILNEAMEIPAPVTNPPPPATAPEVFISKAEMAKRLDRDVRTVTTWMRKGHLPYYKIGHTVVFKYSEVEKQLAVMCRINRGRPEL